MKNIKIITVLAIFLPVVFFSCKNAKNPTNPVTNPTATAPTATPTQDATVSGTPKNTATVTATVTVTVTITLTALTSPTMPVTGVSLMASYPAGNLPTIRHDATGYIISYYYWGDMWLMKADAAGDCVWARNYFRGAVFSDYVDTPYGVAAASDGYYLTGDSHPLGGGSNSDYHDFMAIKTDLYGNEIWRHTIDDRVSFGSDVTADNDGGIFTYIGGGQSMIIKYSNDPAGDTVWSKTYPMPVYEIPGVIWNGSGFFVSGADSSGAYTEMLGAGGIGAGQVAYGLTGTFGQWGPSESPSCARPGGGYLTARSYKPAMAATVDVILMESDATGAITASRIYGRPADDEIVTGVATDGKWILIPCNLNSSSVPYIMLLDSAGNFVEEIALTGFIEVDSIIAGNNSGEFIIAGDSTGWTNMLIEKVTIN